MRRPLPVVVLVLTALLAGCASTDARPEQVNAEASELRNNHARTVADVAERDLKLAELARGEKATATLAGLDQALAADLGEVDYLLAVYDSAKSPEKFAIERTTTRRLAAIRDKLRRAVGDGNKKP